MMIFQELLKPWAFPVLTALRSYFLGTWMSPAKDTKLASCVDNCAVLEKLERERHLNILSALYSNTLLHCFKDTVWGTPQMNIINKSYYILNFVNDLLFFSLKSTRFYSSLSPPPSLVSISLCFFEWEKEMKLSIALKESPLIKALSYLCHSAEI